MPHDTKAQFTVSRTFVNLFFIGLGGILWYLSYATQSSLVSETHSGKSATQLLGEILKDIGVVVFSLALVDMLWERFGGDPVQTHIKTLAETTNNALRIVQQAHTNGLSDVEARVGNITDAALTDLIYRSQFQIDLCAYTLYYVLERDQLAQALYERVGAGVPVRILIGDPANPSLFENVQPQTRIAMQGQMKFVIESIGTWKTKHAAVASTLDARKITVGPLCTSILRFDDRMLVVNYLWTRFTSETPVLTFQGLNRPLFRTYAEEFDHLFSKGTAI
jgi:hypothetical protein